MARALVAITYGGRSVEAGEDLDALRMPEDVEAALIERGDAEADEKPKSGSKSGSRKSS